MNQKAGKKDDRAESKSIVLSNIDRFLNSFDNNIDNISPTSKKNRVKHTSRVEKILKESYKNKNKYNKYLLK